MANVRKPRREAGMKEFKEKGNLKHLIKENDNTLQCAWQLNKHGRRLSKDKSVAYMDGEELENEIDGFIQYCIDNKQVPSMVGLALWLGISTQTIKSWLNDQQAQHHFLMKNVSDFFHKIIEQKALDGEMNPILYMFYGKNWFGLSDKTEIVHKSEKTQTIDISEQQRILRSTPGVVLDAEFSEKTEAENLGISENLGTHTSENLGKNTENLADLLRGTENLVKNTENLDENAENLAENLGTHTSENLGGIENLAIPENLGTHTRTRAQDHVHVGASAWDDDI